MNARLVLAAVSVASLCACGGTEKLSYAQKELEPKSVIWAPIPVNPALSNDPESVALVITDRSSWCNEYDGLPCFEQPLAGTALVVELGRPKTESFDIGATALASWRDYQQPREFHAEATSGKITVSDVSERGGLSGELDLQLPEGAVKGEFSASYCKPMRDWYYRCTGGTR